VIFKKIFSLAAVSLLVSGIAFAQTTSGNVAGSVKDATGAAVPHAAIVLTSESTGVETTTVSNAAGEFLIQNLLPADYDVKTVAPGFAPSLIKGIHVELNSTVTANVNLSVGTQAVVEVNADVSALLDTTSQNLTSTFSNEELSLLPTAATGVGVLNVSLLSPGVASSGGLGIGVGPSVGGQRPRNNNFTIEGIDNNDKAVTGPLVYLPNDAVGSFTLITNQFSPEFGHSSGGQFNTTTLSGTNKFHGRAYEYFQNRNLNAAQGTTATAANSAVQSSATSSSSSRTTSATQSARARPITSAPRRQRAWRLSAAFLMGLALPTLRSIRSTSLPQIIWAAHK
jgi:hypothetical protein